MDERTHGYDVTLRYTYGYCREMAPRWLDFAAAGSDAAVPAAGTGRFLELGCGQGLGLCLLAAADPGREFVGVDLMAQHIAHARSVAEAAGLTNVRFIEADFVALARDWPEDLGRFHHVALHGIYSWVTAPVREALVECLDRAVVPGGLVYMGYNAQPGSLATVPFRHVTRLIREREAGPAEEVLERSISLFERLRAGGAATFQLLPGLGARLDSLRRRDVAQLAHEYLHASWEPMWHSSVAADLATVELEFAGSASLAERLLPTFLPPPLRDIIAGESDQQLRQDVQDFVINQFYRRDVFRRAPAMASTADGLPGAQTRVLLLDPPSGETVTVRTTFGEMTLQPPAFAGIVEALADGPVSLAELATLLNAGGRKPTETRQLVLMLLHAGMLAIAAEPFEGESFDGGPAQRLNAVIAREAARGLPYDHLAAPALGGAIPADPADILLLDAWLESEGSADEHRLAEGLLASLAATGRKLQRGAEVLEGVQEGREARRRARQFLDRDLARWRRLGAVA